MKNIYKLMVLVLFVGVFTSCEEDLIIYDVDNGQTGHSFARAAQTIEFCTTSSTITVESTTRTNTDRTINFNVNTAMTTAEADEYTLGATSVTIPAGEFVGSTTIDVNFDNLASGIDRIVVLDLEIPEGTILSAPRGRQTISFSGACTLNEVVVDIAFDDYPEETAWQIRDAANNIIAGDTAFGNHAGESSFTTTLCLPDGEYIYILFDFYEDGICCSFGNGEANLELVECAGNIDLLEGNPIKTFGANDSRVFTLGN
ncbi:MAG: DUF1735 domain-containing protein [Bacteroidota bacterium]